MAKRMTVEVFLERSKGKHGDKYEYLNLSEFKNSSTVMRIKCPIHGEFDQLASSHAKGFGCKKCASLKPLDYHIDKFRDRHGDTYDYSRIDKITNSRQDIEVVCPHHGSFTTKVYLHKEGGGCPKCHSEKKNQDKVKPLKFAEDSVRENGWRIIGGYQGMSTECSILCTTCRGVFRRTPTASAQYKCKCTAWDSNKAPKKSRDEYIADCVEVHGGKYDYSLIKSGVKSKDVVSIICPDHGVFKCRLSDHIHKHSGCKKCSNEAKSVSMMLTNDQYLDNVKKVHGDRYDLTNVEYGGYDVDVEVICNEHGKFRIRSQRLTEGYGCPRCNSSRSLAETELLEYVESISGVTSANKTIIDGNKELDIFVGQSNLAIEFNGLYWHSEKFRGMNYHLQKTIACSNMGIQLIHIFEDEWAFKKEIVKSVISSKLGSVDRRVYARNTKVVELTPAESSDFCDKNHLQGSCRAKIKLGLKLDGELVSIMTFSPPRIALGSKGMEGEFEMIRFCNKLNTTVVGGASKLYKYFLRTYKPRKVITFADMRYSDGGLYETLGFELVHRTKPNYFWTKNLRRYHRYNFAKHKLVKQGFDKDKTERQIMESRGYFRIFDCGNYKFEYDVDKCVNL